MLFLFSHFVPLILAFLISTSFAIPLTGPHTQDVSPQPALIAHTIPPRPNPQVPAHQPRALPAHRSSGAVLRFGSWRLIYQKVTAVFPPTYAGVDPVKQLVLGSLGQLWDKVKYTVDGVRDTNEDVVQPWNHITFSTEHIELVMTSADAIIWKDLGAYADALAEMVGTVPKFWEVGLSCPFRCEDFVCGRCSI